MKESMRTLIERMALEIVNDYGNGSINYFADNIVDYLNGIRGIDNHDAMLVYMSTHNINSWADIA